MKINGDVKQEMSWAEDEIRAMETMDAAGVNSNGESETYTGVSLLALLEMAQPKTQAVTVVFIADDGNSVEAPLADVTACNDYILSFRNKGGFRLVMPGFDQSMDIKGVVEIQVKK